MRTLVLFVALAACSGGAGKPSVLSMNLLVSGSGETDLQSTSSDLTTQSVASASASGLDSLKYFITNISICEGATIVGTGFSSQTNCLVLYRGPSDAYFDAQPQDPRTDRSAEADYARRTTAGWIDLMDPTQRAGLSAGITLHPSDAHAYNYGFINWQYPVKVTAELTQPGASAPTLFTHDGTISGVPDGTGNTWYTTTSTTSFTKGPASEAVVLFPNGGAWFAFQAPFVITSEDVAGGAAFVLDLTLDPDRLVLGYPTSGDSLQDTLADNSGNAISLPLLDLQPIPHKRCERAIKEVYLGTVSTAADSFDLRLELFYRETDPQKTIYGVEAAQLPNASTRGAARAPKIARVHTNDDGTIDLVSEANQTTYAAFKRRSTVGDKTALTLDGAPVEMTLARIIALEAGGTCNCHASADCPRATDVCVAGVCTACGGAGTPGVKCASGAMCSSGKCVDISGDVKNCGGIGTVCASGNTCVNGHCTCGVLATACAPGTASCSACGTQTCTNGVCACATSKDCPDLDDVCDGGTCKRCGVNESSGTCKSGLTCCGSVGCVNTLTSPTNCGACGVSCGHCEAYQGKGYCAPQCSSPFVPGNVFGDCDGNPLNGCETSLMTNDNCNICGRRCKNGTCKAGYQGAAFVGYDCF
jgi:hypothetical protein